MILTALPWGTSVGHNGSRAGTTRDHLSGEDPSAPGASKNVHSREVAAQKTAL